MFVIHFFENKTIVLSQLLQHIPSIEDPIKIKGRKGKVLTVQKISENSLHVYVGFEPVSKIQPLAKDLKYKKR